MNNVPFENKSEAGFLFPNLNPYNKRNIEIE